MNKPAYTRWFDNTNASSPIPLSATPDTRPFPVSGQYIDNAGPPSEPELTYFHPEISIPYETNEKGDFVSVFAEVIITYRVDDWGSIQLANGKHIIELIETKEASGSYGGHQVWEKTYRAVLPSGPHVLNALYQNIDMPDNSINRKICELTWVAYKLVQGGRKDPNPCSCNGDTCSPEGGAAPTSRSINTTSVASSSAATSSMVSTSG